MGRPLKDWSPAAVNPFTGGCAAQQPATLAFLRHLRVLPAIDIMHCPSSRLLIAALALGAVATLSGCATIAGDSTQKVSIQTVDAQGRSVDGMSCKVTNADAEYVGVTPMFDTQVRRSSNPLIIECRGDRYPMARGVVVSRAVNMQPMQMLLPGGTSFMVLDHLTGYMYAYPRWVRLQVGADMVFDRRDDNGRSATPGLVTRQFDAYARYAFGGPPVRAD